MFSKILIANRGEIACRVIRTARRMGIATVAVYSEADRDALHVEMADEAVAIGAAPSAESYLVIDRIVAACRDTGAQAVHPGYGFLSENRDFALALAGAGITFIGPPPGAIEAMGDKIESKKIAAAAGVNVIPGHPHALSGPDEAVAVARGIGYPVMLKASAGGGGKGMRVVYDDAGARDGFERASSEARTSFGDDRVLAEKFIESPRHIEIQVMADAKGNAVYLNERECSIQRRHQKVIEEAPSPFLDPETRAAMGEQAVALARAVDYCSAGTVEFVVGADRGFYFLEMNTRLQVEHPITERITGLDLVELMIRVAAGESLPLRQEDVGIDGWAIEARVYAEDPARGFLPSTGRLVRYRPPSESGSVRVDTGVHEGGEVSMYYDPMIAKLVTHGPDRESATATMSRALDEFYIRGPAHNLSFLNALVRHPRFVSGELTTAFIEETYPDGYLADTVEAGDLDPVIGVAAYVHHMHELRARRISGRMDGAADLGTGSWDVTVAGESHLAKVRLGADGLPVVSRDGRDIELRSAWRIGEPLFIGYCDERRICVQIEPDGVGYLLRHGGSEVRVVVAEPRLAGLIAHMPVKTAPDLSSFVLSPMPGLLVSVAVAEGDAVKAGQELAVVEAMKMENVLRAAEDGVVAHLLASPGETLAVDQPIIEFERD